MDNAATAPKRNISQSISPTYWETNVSDVYVSSGGHGYRLSRKAWKSQLRQAHGAGSTKDAMAQYFTNQCNHPPGRCARTARLMAACATSSASFHHIFRIEAKHYTAAEDTSTALCRAECGSTDRLRPWDAWPSSMIAAVPRTRQHKSSVHMHACTLAIVGTVGSCCCVVIAHLWRLNQAVGIQSA